MKVLVTGGAGFIGSTISSALLDKGHTPVILDSLVNGREEFVKGRIFYKGDINDEKLIDKIFNKHKDINYVIHCAALIVVPESVEKPFEYYYNNVSKSLIFFKKVIDNNCKRILFSSSASIYGSNNDFKVTETSNISGNCPYARTKIIMEQILEDFSKAYNVKCLSLRYFNPIGTDPLFRTGSYLKNPSHLLAKILNVYFGKEDVFKITGNNWETKDGTGIRDYIHVWDIANAHVLAIEKFDSIFNKNNNYDIINLGAGEGITVKEFLTTFEKVVNKEINTIEDKPRPGDTIGTFANNNKARELLGWQINYSIEQAIKDTLKWEELKNTILKNK